MPYRRLPKTDSARLKALTTLVDNNDIYTVEKRFLDWKGLSEARRLRDQLLTLNDQYRLDFERQSRSSKRVAPLQRNATLYLSHFLQVLLMSVERGEVKPEMLELYGMQKDTRAVPSIAAAENLFAWGEKVQQGERERQKRGGRPIYNPSIGMVATHLDIYKEAYDKQRLLMQRTDTDQKALQKLRPEVDALLLDLWNQIEAHYAAEPLEERVKHCQELGVIYYYRKNELH